MLTRIQHKLGIRRQRHLERKRNVSQGRAGVTTTINGKSVLNFCSNDYLGLSQHPQVIAAAEQACHEVGAGATSAWLVNGYHARHSELEEKLADFLQRPRALIFGSGYLQNIGILSSVLSRLDHAIVDRACHASLLDGVLLARASLSRYRHLEMTHLEECLQQRRGDRQYVVTDSVFSMDGDLAPIDTISTLATRYDASLIVDDAHGFGVMGEHGRGVVDVFPNAQVDILTGTLSKSLGSYGAFVTGSDETIEYIMQFARSYMYTTALPPSSAAAASAAIDVLRTEGWRRQRINALIAYFRKQAIEAELPITDSHSMIQPIIIGDAALATRISSILHEKYHISLLAMRPPTVAKGTARLRVSLCCDHQESQIDQLIMALTSIFREQKYPEE